MFRILKNNRLLFFLLGLDILVLLTHFVLKDTYGFFNLDGEQNLNSTYSGLKLLGVALVASLQLLMLFQSGEKFGQKAMWLLVAASFAYLGVDEMVALHERVGFVVNNLIGVTNAPGASFRWIIYYAPFILIAMMVYARFIAALWSAHRSAAIFVFCGVLLFTAAMGVEVISGRIIYPEGAKSGDFSLYFYFIVWEEIIELAGATFFFAGIARHVITTFHQRYFFRERQ